VVVVNFNGVDFLSHSLFSLRTQTYPLYEIIVVDNASNDESVPFIRSNYPQVKILESPENLGLPWVAIWEHALPPATWCFFEQ